MFELHITVKLYEQNAAFLMLTHISSLSRRICVREVCLMFVPLHSNI